MDWGGVYGPGGVLGVQPWTGYGPVGAVKVTVFSDALQDTFE